MADIVLTTFNARYAHTAVGLRFLKANLGPLEDRCVIRELTLQSAPGEALDIVLAESPRIVGIGVYVWNAEPSLELVRLLKATRPEITVVVGGPEVSYEVDEQPICGIADYAICGEAEMAFADLCCAVLGGKPPAERVIEAPAPDLSTLRTPYHLYNDEDIAHRVIYVETSRGCPFECAFCLSAVEGHVRTVDLDAFLGRLERLFERGVRRFKFLDRTFNLTMDRCRRVLQFFLERADEAPFAHFEMVPERFPDALVESLSRFEPGAVQLEIGLQTFDPEVAERVDRRLHPGTVEANLRRLREHTGVHLHVDLIAGLPGEDLEGFARGFDRLIALNPHEIQVGILKRLRGAPIARHDAAFGMVYDERPPYGVLRTSVMDAQTLQRLRHFARLWDRIANRGHFPRALPLVWGSDSPFWSFWALTDYILERTGASCGIAMMRLSELMLEHLTAVRGLDPGETAEALAADYAAGGRRRVPRFLTELLSPG